MISMLKRVTGQPALPFLLLFILPGFLNAQSPPDYYVYNGNRIKLQIDPENVAVRLTPSLPKGNQPARLQVSGLSIHSSRDMGFQQWQILNVDALGNDIDSINRRLDRVSASTGVAFVSPVFREEHGAPISLSQDVLVRFKQEFRARVPEILRAYAPDLDIVNDRFGGMDGSYQLRSRWKNGFTVLARANALVEQGYAEWSEPDFIVTGSHELIPNDPLFPQLWGIKNTGQFSGKPGADMAGDRAWDITTGDTSVKVMVIDCGVQQNHPDIHQVPGLDFTGQGGGGGPVNSCDNHGTAVAGCVAATINNGIGITGIAPTCYVISARTLIANSTCDNTFTSQISWTVNALAYAGAHGIRITNFSNQFWSGPSSSLEAEYQYTHDSLNVVHFAAAGNGSTSVYYPASIPVVNAVGGMNSKGVIASFSNHGPALDFVAPADSIWVTDRTGSSGYSSGDYYLYRGTSFASPYAAGVAALILSRFPNMTSNQVEAKMRCSAVDLGSTGYDTVYGWGFVNAYNAIRSTCILTPVPNISVSADPGICGSVVYYQPPATSGDCSPVTCTPPSGSLFPIGTTVVSCSDTTGDTVKFTVTVTGGSVAQGVLRDSFNRPDSPLPGSNKWSLIQNQPSGGTINIVSNAIQPYSTAGNGSFGGVVWDTLMGSGTEESFTLAQKSGSNNNTSFFLYAKMSSKDYNTATGYRMRYLQQNSTDVLEIHRVGPGYAASTTLASTKYEVNVGDVVTFRVACDNKTLVVLVNGNQILSATDQTYMPSQWYYAIRACVLATPVRLDNFLVSSQASAPPPAAPLLLAPASGSAGQPTTLTLSWNPSAGATSYHCQLATDSLFTSLVVDDPTLITTSRQVGPLTANTKYYWRVNASNGGGTSAYSSVWNFTTVILAPAAPVLAGPANGAANVSLTPTLTWNASAGATSYRLQVASDSLFASPVLDDSTLTSTSRQAGPLANTTTYYWRVSAKNSAGSSAFSGVWHFVTVPLPPPAPSLVSPANGTPGLTTMPTLQWNASAGAVQYRCQAATDSLFSSIVVNDSALTGTSVQIGPLGGTTEYYWRVNASNSGGTSAYSAVWNFTTMSAPVPPPVPVLASPANGAVNQPVTVNLSWNSSSGALQYILQVASDSAFSSLVAVDTTTATSQSAGPLANNTAYYWRVSAQDAGGSSAFSAAWKLTTIVAVPAAPALLTPANDTGCQAATLTCTWSAVSGAAKYRFQLASDTLFTSIVLDDSTLTTASRAVSGLASNSAYSWRVAAANVAGWGNWSPRWGFATFPAGTLRDDFNRPDGGLPGSNKWALILNQPNNGSMNIVSSAIQPYSSAGNYNFGGVVWDSLCMAGSEISVTLKQKSGNTSYTSLFLYAKMNNKDYNTGTGYRLRYFEQSGADILEIHRVGTGYPNSVTLASAAHEVNINDVITFRVMCDNQTLVGLVNGVPILSAKDAAYMPSQWYFAVRGCVFPTPVRFDDFQISPAAVVPAESHWLPVVQEQPGHPKEYRLDQNHPNPFNPSTVITYALPVDSRVVLSIYNVLGQEVERLVDGAEEAGYRSVEFDASHLPTGIYFYRLSAGTYVETKKMILVR